MRGFDGGTLGRRLCSNGILCINWASMNIFCVNSLHHIMIQYVSQINSCNDSVHLYTISTFSLSFIFIRLAQTLTLGMGCDAVKIATFPHVVFFESQRDKIDSHAAQQHLVWIIISFLFFCDPRDMIICQRAVLYIESNVLEPGP